MIYKVIYLTLIFFENSFGNHIHKAHSNSTFSKRMGIIRTNEHYLILIYNFYKLYIHSKNKLIFFINI